MTREMIDLAKIKAAAEIFIKADKPIWMNPQAVLELITRLEAAEKCLFQMQNAAIDLAKDADRLIWICDHLFESMWNGVIDKGSKTHWRIAGDYRHTVAKMEGFYFRDAIDAAMKEKP